MHDFRSDTVTLPTPAMMTAIANARLGDAARGDDPTVQELEALACDLTGKEGALLLPSGTMANLAAVIAHDCRGGEVIVEASSHIYNAEGGGLSTLAGALARPLTGAGGVMTAAQIASAIRDGRDVAAPTRLVCIENTHNAAGGRVIDLAHLDAIAATAKRAGLPLHLDGARLFNAAAYLDVNIAALCAYADSVWFALCKGLGAPIGAILLGGREFMSKARRAAKSLGGGMRQAGLIAAPAIIALRDPYERHRRDHALAHELATGIAGLDPTLVEVARVQTNIVNCDVTRYADDAADIRKRLAARGILVNNRRAIVRFVTHAQVDDRSVAAAVSALADVLDSTCPRRSAP